ncbi:ubiE/COQ5 methyltransferase, putative [Plasmodium relictum]|uniref:2-methoxy-6-polyprenyl-1,4-benzoquinol methylase, mitochondrial n=1 Tax=Plasmodium relictum TaxID=85471 RepID=A0A1J1H5W1_PLARL|nr:ubiE/COQ5 methyltransferase, putative [Plasmodium relictum]CRG98820.1 ubiE/COQ5 methyltransferase, putative [Plasmodium relictum]
MKFIKFLNYDYNRFSKKKFGGFLRRKVHLFSTNNSQFNNEKLYNFGFQKVSEEIKSKLIHNLFSNVSNKYDIMNDLMSLLLHRSWKNELVKELDIFLKYYSYNIHEICKNNKTFLNEEILTEENSVNDNVDYNNIKNEEKEIHENKNDTESLSKKKRLHNFYKCKILDLAGGTGDIAFRILEKSKHYLKQNNEKFSDNFYQKYMPDIIVCDANSDMINVGIKKAKDLNYYNNITWLIENAENLKSIEDNSIDIITLSFGIRNFTNIPIALKEIHRVLKPGGRFLCLEFSKVNCDITNIFYKFYLNNCIPLLGKLVANDKDSYKYLAESIQTFLTPDELSQLIYENNFKNISYTTMTMGIVAIHSAYKLN